MAVKRPQRSSEIPTVPAPSRDFVQRPDYGSALPQPASPGPQAFDPNKLAADAARYGQTMGATAAWGQHGGGLPGTASGGPAGPPVDQNRRRRGDPVNMGQPNTVDVTRGYSVPPPGQDSLSREMARRMQSGEAAIQPGGYNPNAQDRGQALADLFAQRDAQQQGAAMGGIAQGGTMGPGGVQAQQMAMAQQQQPQRRPLANQIGALRGY